MKSITTFLAFVLYLGTASAQYILDDFRHIKFGSHIDSIFIDNKKVNFEKSQELSAPHSFIIRNDDLTVGTVDLRKIFYIFTEDGHFDRVAMIGNGLQGFREMKYILTYKFDDPNLKDLGDGVQYNWIVDGVRVYLTYEPDGENFTVDISSDYQLNESKKKNRTVNDF